MTNVRGRPTEWIRSGLAVLLASGTCFSVLWLTLPCRPRAVLHTPSMAGWYISRDASTIATVGLRSSETAEHETIQIWDTASGRVRASFTIPWQSRALMTGAGTEYNPRADFARSGGGRFFVLADADRGKVTLWHAATGEVHAIWPGRDALTTEDDRVLAVVTPDGRAVQLRDLGSGQELATIPARLPERPATRARVYQPCAFTADGRWLAVADGADVRLWDVAGGRLRATLSGHTYPVQALRFAPDGSLLASRATLLRDESRDFELRLWEPATGKPRRAFEMPGRETRTEALQFTTSGRKLELGDQYVHRVADLLAWKPTVPTPEDAAPGLENCPDFDENGAVEITSRSGRWTARYNHSANAIELTSGDTTGVLRIFAPAAGYGRQLQFSPDERTLAIAVELLPRQPPGWFVQLLQSAGALPPARRASSNEPPAAEFWDVATQSHRATLEGFFFGFTEDGRGVLMWQAAPTGDRIEVWDWPPRPPVGLIAALSGIAALVSGLAVLSLRGWRQHRLARPMVAPAAGKPGA